VQARTLISLIAPYGKGGIMTGEDGAG